MLIIREDVDLKELEKFGFKYKKETKNSNELYEINTDDGVVVIYIWCREVFAQNLDVLYDLIQAGLVEKVDDYVNRL